MTLSRLFSYWTIVMTERYRGWESSAAYLYVLHLDAACIAWEFLRRNPRYRQTWRQREPGTARLWGLSFR